jgi:hypothetical protein
MSRRFERKQREHLRLTPRDLEAVVAVFESRYLTNREIGRLLFAQEQSSLCRQRLRFLFDLGYLRKRAAGPNDPDIYYLGLQGRKYIAALGIWSRVQVDAIAGVSGEETDAPQLMMEHELTLAHLYVNARLECRRHGWELAWKNTRMLELDKLGIEPDAWLDVACGSRHHEAFLEFTAAMPVASELSGKLSRYQAYWERTQHRAAVLWLTTTGAKANRLLEGIRASEYRDCFLVGLIEDAGSFLTRRMWRWGDAAQESSDEGALSAMLQWLYPPTSPRQKEGGPALTGPQPADRD